MFRKIAEVVTNRPFLFLILFCVIAVVGLVNLSRIKFDFTPPQLFKVSGDDLAYREGFADVFGREDNSFFILIDSKDVYEPDNLVALGEVVRELKNLKSVRTAESLVTLSLPRSGDELGALTTEPMIPNKGKVTREQADAFRIFASQEPLLAGRLVNAKGTRTLVMVWFETEISDIGMLQIAVDEVDDVFKRVSWLAQNSLRFGGIAHLRTEIVRNLKRQQLTFIPVTGLAYMLVLFFLFRRRSGVLAPIFVVIVASLMITSVMVWTGSSINIINNIVPSLIFIIGISDSIHMLIRDAEEMELQDSRKEAIKRMIWYTGAACLLTSLTTAVGFFSLFMASTKILRDFGWQAGLGVMFAYSVTLFGLPAILVFMKPIHRSNRNANEGKLEKYIARLATKVLNNTKKTLAISIAITAIFLFFASQVVIDTTLLEVYTDDHPSYQTTEILNHEFGGTLPFEISLNSKEKDTFKDPIIFRKMKEIQNFASIQEHVLATDSFVDFHQAARGALLGSKEERKKMPASREQVEQLHLLIAGNPDELNGVNRFVSPDFRRVRILLRVFDAGSRAQMKLANKLKLELGRQFDGTPVNYRITGDAYVASKSLSIFVHDLFYSLMFAALIIFFMMTIVFKSLKLGLISIVPNLVPLILTCGYMGMTGTNLNTTTVIIFAISLGIAVDDTIHFLARFEEGRKKKNPRGDLNTVQEALMEAYDGAGRAMLLTSFMLLIGLIVLATSDFLPTRQFAILTSFTITGAILGDLFILPPMLLLVFGNDEGDKNG